MPPYIATLVCAAGIIGLFILDRNHNVTTSKALWIPVVWVWIAGGREASRWMIQLGMAPAGVSTEDYVLSNPVDTAVYTALLVLGMWALFRRWSRVKALLRTNLPIVLFFLYCAASIAWSDYPDIAAKRWVKALGDVVMITIVLTEAHRITAIKRFLGRAAFVLIPLSLLLIKYYPGLGTNYKASSGAAVYVGITTHKNLLGIICLVFGLASEWRLFTAWRARQTRSLTVHGVVLIMVIWLFWKADSMTALACFLLAGGLMAITSLSR